MIIRCQVNKKSKIPQMFNHATDVVNKSNPEKTNVVPPTLLLYFSYVLYIVKSIHFTEDREKK